MKRSLILRIMTVATVISLLLLALPATPVLAAATLSTSPLSGPVGTAVTVVTGTGFALSSSGFVWLDADNDFIRDAGEPALAASTDGAGVLSAPGTMAVPALPRGTYYIHADVPGDTTIDASSTITVTPKITLTPTTGNVGDTITVIGTGFNSSSTVTIYFDTASVGTVTTPYSGSFATTFTVPDSYRGSHSVKGTDTSGESPLVIFTTLNEITVTPTSGSVGDTVTVSGSGFAPSTAVVFYFDGVTIGSSTTSTATGSFSSTLTIPATSRGSHTIRAQDASANSATVTFTVAHKIAVTPASGYVGDTLTVSGSGFAANSAVTFYFDEVIIGTTVTTNSGGTFSGHSLTIPSASRGSHTIRVQDASTNSASAAVSVTQKLTIDPGTGTSGSTVTVSGTGFGASRPISIKYNNVDVATNPATITTSATGSFSGSFTVPMVMAGTYVVQVSDGTNTATANFVSTTNASISPTTSEAAPGHVGTEVTITGSGFKASASVTATYAGDTIGTTVSDTNGNFSIKFTIPASSSGSKTITVSDAYITKEFTFVMESTAPAIPQPLLPMMGAKASAEVYFDWEDVSDASEPVTYELQIATDSGFSNILVRETGLTVSEYTIDETQALESTSKDAPYYWRIRAVDAASNPSGYTGAGTFYVGFVFPEIKGWILFGLLALVAAAFFFLGWWLARRLARY